MAMPVLERTRTNENTAELKAYGKLSGGAEPANFTEEQRAMDFNARISENYQKLINPEYKSAEDFFAGAPVEQPQAEPVYETPEEYAMATLYPERAQAAQPQAAPVQERPRETAPRFEHQRVTEDLFRADSPINAPRMQAAAPVAAPAGEQVAFAAPSFAEREAGFAENAAEEDITPTSTTIQYRTDLYRDEQREVTEEKKGHALTAKGKLLMAVYAVVVVVVLALIIINTSVLNTLDSAVAEREQQLNAMVAQAQELDDRIDYLTDPDTIIQRAEDELHMTMGNR